jgi:hypothetical protein
LVFNKKIIISCQKKNYWKKYSSADFPAEKYSFLRIYLHAEKFSGKFPADMLAEVPADLSQETVTHKCISWKLNPQETSVGNKQILVSIFVLLNFLRIQIGLQST